MKLDKITGLINNLKNYYYNNKTNLLATLGFSVIVFIISLLIVSLVPITNCAGSPLDITLEMFIIIYVGVTILLIFFILFAVLLKLIKDKILQNNEENKIIRDIPWLNIIFTLFLFLFATLLPLYQLYSGKILICGIVPEITLPLYLIVLAIYIIAFILLVLFIEFMIKIMLMFIILLRKILAKNK